MQDLVAVLVVVLLRRQEGLVSVLARAQLVLAAAGGAGGGQRGLRGTRLDVASVRVEDCMLTLRTC